MGATWTPLVGLCESACLMLRAQLGTVLFVPSSIQFAGQRHQHPLGAEGKTTRSTLASGDVAGHRGLTSPQAPCPGQRAEALRAEVVADCY